jgi:hypothetical protein
MDQEKTRSEVMDELTKICLRETKESFIKSAIALIEAAVADNSGRARTSDWSLRVNYKPVGEDGRYLAKTISVETDQRGVGFDESNEGTEFLARQEASARFLEMKRKQYEHENSLYGTTMWEGDKK